MAGDPEILKKAKALDDMERSVTSSEADVLDRVLEAYNDGKPPKKTDAQKIEAMYSKYLEPCEVEGGNAAPGGEDDDEYPMDEQIDL